MKKLLARIRIQAAQLKNNEMWHELTYESSRIVRCSCGGCVEDDPGTGEYDGGGCSHIVAFYAGLVTEDEQEAGTRIDPPRLGQRLAGPWLVQLTPAARELFSWRWAAKKLASS
jgi:hypothetical protein